MKKYGIIFLLLLVLASCTSNSIYEKPKDLIPKDSMVLLLKDLYLAAAAKNVKNTQLQRRFSYVPLVYAKYKIDSTRFQASNVYYTSKIDIYEPLFDEVLKILEAERTLYARQKKVRDSTRQDSIKKARKKIIKDNKDRLQVGMDKKKLGPQEVKKKQ